MKLGIFCNFTYPSTGGSENVCKVISESMINDYGMEVTCFGYNIEYQMEHNGVIYKKCLRDKELIKQIQDFDHIFVYSDSCWCWKTILENLDQIKPDISIALVGMYAMIADKSLFKIFKENRKRFKVITHSKYIDYQKCFEEGIGVTIIPNGIDLNEFKITKKDRENFRKKYNIETDYIILNLANFFYGKNNEYMADIGQKFAEKRDKKDFTMLSVSNSVKYPHEKIFLDRCKKRFKEKSKDGTLFKYKFLRNIPREDVLSALYAADVLVSTSGKEVAPLVMLESMITSTLWVSMDVGNVEDLQGGFVIRNDQVDHKGYKVINEIDIKEYVNYIHLIMSDPPFLDGKRQSGRDQIYEKYNWSEICDIYYNIFIS